jgi:hypothetical protein
MIHIQVNNVTKINWDKIGISADRRHNKYSCEHVNNVSEFNWD